MDVFVKNVMYAMCMFVFAKTDIDKLNLTLIEVKLT